MTSPFHGEAVRQALALLGVERLVLAIHDASFPAGDGDLGRGSPYSAAGHAFFDFVRGLGFSAVQLGPQGLTARDNPSPYDAMLFSRDPLSISLPAATGTGTGTATGTDARRADHRGAFDRQALALAALWQQKRDAWAGDVDAFARANADWLARDEHHAADVVPPAHYRFVQWLAHRQHDELRAHLGPLGLGLWGDMQVGISYRDRLALSSLFLDGYALGAPPSRTTPAGQPWNYPVLDPAQYDGAAGALVARRVDKLAGEYDGLRIDHPHGLIDPWVYRGSGTAAVQAGARLFSTPDAPDHPALARFSIARPDEIDRDRVRWDDGWVRALDDAAVRRYAILFEVVVARLAAHGRRVDDLVCEILSTWPYPIRRVMEKAGLGRLCVTQKANLDDASDVYRSENARPQDWIMVGNHDTKSLWQLVEGWHGTAAADKRARQLAERLEPEPAARAQLAASLAASPGRLATAMFAELFVGPARNVSIFFADLFGYRETYNVPGTISDDNWSLRVAPDYARAYAAAVAGDEPRALDLRRALAIALRARGIDATFLTHA